MMPARRAHLSCEPRRGLSANVTKVGRGRRHAIEWRFPQVGPRLSLPFAVKKMTRDTAELYGLHDRGLLAPGYRADLNVIDLDGLTLRLPEIVHDLPTGARRLIQRADGYLATISGGEVTWRGGQETGARPGRVIRGSQPAPG